MKFTGGTADSGTFTLIPEIDDVSVMLIDVSTFEQNPNRLKLVFRIDDYDEDDLEDDEPSLVGIEHWEAANMPKGKITPRHRLHFLISGLIGHTLGDDEDVDLDEYLNNQYKADFKHVDAMVANPDNSFSVRRDDKGKALKKAQISRLKPIKAKKKTIKAEADPFADDEAAD